MIGDLQVPAIIGLIMFLKMFLRIRADGTGPVLQFSVLRPVYNFA